MRGFQLWINLPAAEKMKPASYRDIQPAEIPIINLSNGGKVKIIAGKFLSDGLPVAGPIQGLTTDPLYFDVELPANGEFSQLLKNDYNAFIYPYEGSINIGPAHEARLLKSQNAGLLGKGETIKLTAGIDGARFILLAGRPLNEPVVQYGPFVMNTREEIEQAIRDYQSGEFTKPIATLAAIE